jgi:hypothetical protein
MAFPDGGKEGGGHLTDADMDALREGRRLGEDASKHLDACDVCQRIVDSLRTFDPEEGVERLLARVPVWAQPRRPSWRLAVGGLAAAIAVGAFGWGAALRARAGEQALAVVQAEMAASESSVVGLRARNDAILATMKSVHGELSSARDGSPEDTRKAIQHALAMLDGALELSADEHQPVIKVAAAPGGQVQFTTNQPTPTTRTLDTTQSGPFVASLVQAKANPGEIKILSFTPGLDDDLVCHLMASARRSLGGKAESLIMAFTPFPKLWAEDEPAPDHAH